MHGTGDSHHVVRIDAQPAYNPRFPEPEHHEVTLRILLADDERAIAITLADDLKRAGHQVRVASDGGEARDALMQETFDVLVTDIRMPVVSGVELLETLKSRGVDTEVIIITGYGTIDSAVDAIRKGGLRLHPQALRQRRHPRRAPQDRGDPPTARRERRAARNPGA